MKKFLLALLVLLSGLSLRTSIAQDVPDDEQPSMESRSKFNFFGEVLMEPHLFNQELAFNMGAAVGVTYLDHFYLGGYYSALVSQHYRNDIETHLNEKLRASFNHGGFMMGYIWKPQGLVNLNFGLRGGWGSVWYFDDNITNNDKLKDLYWGTRDRIFVLTPQILCTFTPITWLRVGVGFGYRSVLGLQRYKSADYDSPVGVITLSFGSFKAKGGPAQEDEINSETAQ
jgi:hypothetical protein